MAGKIDKRNLSLGEKRLFLLGVVMIVLMFGLMLPQATLARTWYIKVDGTGDAPTIQAGVDSAAAGDTVLVGPGTYSGRVILSKDVSLIAEETPESTILEAPDGDTVIGVLEVQSPTVIRGFRIRTAFPGYWCPAFASAPMRADGGVGIFCGGSSIRITHNVITDNSTGIAFAHSSALVDSNVISRAGIGLTCQAGTNATISHNQISDCGDLILCYDSSPLVVGNELIGGCIGFEGTQGGSPQIVGNHFSDSMNFAIKIVQSTPLIENNVLDWAGGGIRLSSCGQSGTTVVRGNIVHTEAGGAIDLSDNTGSAIVIENNVTKGVYGVVCAWNSNPLIRNNILLAGTYGIACYESNPVIQCNDVISQIGTPYAGDCSDQTGVNGNFSLDPQFCGIEGSGNYYLQSDSPCAPGNHPDGSECGLVGARPVFCQEVDVKQESWGKIKARFGKEVQK